MDYMELYLRRQNSFKDLEFEIVNPSTALFDGILGDFGKMKEQY
jgi:hypothetical protein